MYAVRLTFSDDPARLELRPAHRERLSALAAAGKLLAAGPWADETGALLVFLLDERADVDAVLAEDPYYSAPGVSVAEIQEWRVVTAHEAVASL